MSVLNKEKKGLYFDFIKDFFSDSRPVLFFFSTHEFKSVDVLLFFKENSFLVKRIKVSYLKLFLFKNYFIFPSFGRQFTSLFSESLGSLLLNVCSLLKFTRKNNFMFCFLFYKGVFFNFSLLKQVLFFKKGVFFLSSFQVRIFILTFFFFSVLLSSMFFFKNVNLSAVS